MAQTFGHIVRVDDAKVTPHSIEIPSFGIIFSFETDVDGGEPFIVVRSTTSRPVEVRPVAMNTIGVRVVK